MTASNQALRLVVFIKESAVSAFHVGNGAGWLSAIFQLKHTCREFMGLILCISSIIHTFVMGCGQNKAETKVLFKHLFWCVSWTNMVGSSNCAI